MSASSERNEVVLRAGGGLFLEFTPGGRELVFVLVDESLGDGPGARVVWE